MNYADTHCPDPVKVVCPIIIADKTWRSIINKFWSVMQRHFTFHRDASCGFHIHVSPVAEKYTLSQLRRLAKAVVV